MSPSENIKYLFFQKNQVNKMSGSAFIEIDFAALVAFSVVFPIGLYVYMMWRRAISRATVLFFGCVLIVLSGVDIFLLQRLKSISIATASLLDDAFFSSEISVALYLLPAVFAGTGLNMISHILIRHLVEAERRFDREGNP